MERVSGIGGPCRLTTVYGSKLSCITRIGVPVMDRRSSTANTYKVKAKGVRIKILIMHLVGGRKERRMTEIGTRCIGGGNKLRGNNCKLYGRVRNPEVRGIKDVKHQSRKEWMLIYVKWKFPKSCHPKLDNKVRYEYGRAISWEEDGWVNQNAKEWSEIVISLTRSVEASTRCLRTASSIFN